MTMKDSLNQWFQNCASINGVLASGLRHADSSTVSRCQSEGFSDELMENGMRCVADTFQVLHLNKINYGRIRWVYSNSVLFCERRPDGACLGVFMPRELRPEDETALEQLFEEFQKLEKNG